MKVLIISCNVNEPFVALVDNFKDLRLYKESSFYNLRDPYKVFPDYSLKQIVQQGEHIDSIVFLGKPLLYLRNLIELHLFLFPETYSQFVDDISNYYKLILGWQKSTYNAFEQNNSFNSVDCLIPRHIHYVRLDDALALSEKNNRRELIITCLSNVFEGTSFCCYETSENGMRCLKELNVSSSFSNLLRIFYLHGSKFDLSNILINLKNGFKFKKPFFKLNNNVLELSNRFIFANEGWKSMYLENNCKIIDDIFNKILDDLMNSIGNYECIKFINDMDIPDNIIERHKNIKFKKISEEDKILTAAKMIANLPSVSVA